jgi:hypothetical protein
VANGVDQAKASKQAVVIVISQVVLVAVDIAILATYTRFSYILKLKPNDLPLVTGFLYTAYIYI